MADNRFQDQGMTLKDLNALRDAQDKYNGALKNTVSISAELKKINDQQLENSKKLFETNKTNASKQWEQSKEYLDTLKEIGKSQQNNIKNIIEQNKLNLDFESLSEAHLEAFKSEMELKKATDLVKAQNIIDELEKDTQATQAQKDKALADLEAIKLKDYYNSDEERNNSKAFKTAKAIMDANSPKERSTVSQLIADPQSFLKNRRQEKRAEELSEKYRELASIDNNNPEADEIRSKLVADIQKIRAKAERAETWRDGMLKAVNALGAELSQAVTETTNTYKTYMGKMNAHLEGTGKTFDSINDTVTGAYSVNSLVSQKSLIENVASLANDGIMYNIEERALLNSLSGKLLDTFSVTNGHLTSLIRIQQADLTQSQLGIETAINRFLNSTFLDSSYLQGTYDTVYGAILDANSMLSYEQTADFSYAVQKWLGSLYSVGVSDSAISTMASGLNALATGDISKISGNVLFTASAANAGLDLAEMMTSGIDSSDINKLMTSMVQYLQQIAQSTADNNITRQAYAGIVNMSVADIAAIQNLSSSMVQSIANTNMTYQDTMNETQYQLSQVASRTTMAEKIDNALDNIMYTWGMNISSNAANYILWRSGDYVKSIASWFGGDEITGNVYAQGAYKVGQGMKAASGILGLIESFSSFKNSWDSAGVRGLSIFDWDQTIQARGGDTSGISYSGLIKSASTKTSKTLADNIVDTNTVALSESDYTKTADDLYTALFVDNKAVHVYVDDISKTAIDLTAINAIKNKLEDGVIRVDIEDNDINTLTSTLSALRQSF